MLQQAAVLAYVCAALVFLAGLIWQWDVLRDVGLAVGIVGVAIDQRHCTARGVGRVVQHMALWDDVDHNPAHRAEIPDA